MPPWDLGFGRLEGLDLNKYWRKVSKRSRPRKWSYLWNARLQTVSEPKIQDEDSSAYFLQICKEENGDYFSGSIFCTMVVIEVRVSQQGYGCVRGLLLEDKTTFFLTLGLCYAWQLAAGRSLLSFPIKRTLKTKGRLINRAEVDSSVSRVAWEMQGKNEFFQKVFQWKKSTWEKIRWLYVFTEFLAIFLRNCSCIWINFPLWQKM